VLVCVGSRVPPRHCILVHARLSRERETRHTHTSSSCRWASSSALRRASSRLLTTRQAATFQPSPKPTQHTTRHASALPCKCSQPAQPTCQRQQPATNQNTTQLQGMHAPLVLFTLPALQRLGFLPFTQLTLFLFTLAPQFRVTLGACLFSLLTSGSLCLSRTHSHPVATSTHPHAHVTTQ